jgi:hypothetical protein
MVPRCFLLTRHLRYPSSLLMGVLPFIFSGYYTRRIDELVGEKLPGQFPIEFLPLKVCIVRS